MCFGVCVCGVCLCMYVNMFGLWVVCVFVYIYEEKCVCWLSVKRRTEMDFTTTIFTSILVLWYKVVEEPRIINPYTKSQTKRIQ